MYFYGTRVLRSIDKLITSQKGKALFNYNLKSAFTLPHSYNQQKRYWFSFTKLISQTTKMDPTKLNELLNGIPLVDIDDMGRFKYILIDVFGKGKKSADDYPTKLIVRGYSRCNYHADIYDEVTDKFPFDLASECLGGGRIEHFPDLKKLKVYGHSTGFGKGDHAEARRILLTKYKDYTIEISDEGY